MRILSLSHRLADPLIDNHHIFNAPVVADYEAIVVDVGGVAESIQNAVAASESYLTHADLPLVNGEPADGVDGIAEALRRRLEEFTKALEHGATVIVFAHAPMPISGVTGFQGLDRYFFLPAPNGMAWDHNTLRGSAGSTFAIAEPEHPAVDLLETFRRDLLYRCVFDERAIAGKGRVIARSEGGLPIGVEFPVLNGRVIFLPSPRESDARWIVQKESKAIVSAFRELLGQSHEQAPAWTRDVAVPGVDALEQQRDLRKAALENASSELATAEEAVDDLSRIRDVLWRAGDLGLQPAVIRCAELLGFEPERNDSDAPLLVDGDLQLHYVVAADLEAVDMAPHYRLRARLDRIIELGAKVPRGLVVANGQRLTRPEERQREIAPSLAVAAESVGYAVITSRTLFAAATAALDGISEETKAAIRTRLLNVDGVVELDDLLRTSEPAEAEPEEPAAEEAAPADAVAADS